jgi:hypothetical protein
MYCPEEFDELYENEMFENEMFDDNRFIEEEMEMDRELNIYPDEEIIEQEYYDYLESELDDYSNNYCPEHIKNAKLGKGKYKLNGKVFMSIYMYKLEESLVRNSNEDNKDDALKIIDKFPDTKTRKKIKTSSKKYPIVNAYDIKILNSFYNT